MLFDEYAAEAHRFGRALAATGLRVRYNQPYSGVDGLIFSAHTHGQRHGIRYLELEVNNSLLRDKQTAEAMAERVALALSGLLRSA